MKINKILNIRALAKMFNISYHKLYNYHYGKSELPDDIKNKINSIENFIQEQVKK